MSLPHQNTQRPPPLAGERNVIRLLGGGFLLMVALLAFDGLTGVRTILSIREKVSDLTGQQFRNVMLIDEVQRAQAALSSVVYRLGSTETPEERDALERSIRAVEHSLRDLFVAVPENDRDIEIWREVEKNAADVKAEATLLLRSDPDSADLQQIAVSRERLLAAIAKLIRSNHQRSSEIRAEIDLLTRRHVIDDLTLLSAGLLVAFACAWLVIRGARRLYRQIALQSDELDRVSWQLLEKQESLARRLSHELHDELGQSLTALKTNISRHGASGCGDTEWMNDCTGLLRDSIRSAHEISQLLRPTILDDFGLESALRWLCERFEERHATDVVCHCDVRGRLDEQTETHLFRIAQEALTNVARHAHAGSVSVNLSEQGGAIVLRVSDDGVGLGANGDSSHRSFGLTGMKARARSLKGEMTIQTGAGRGTTIQVSFPRTEVAHAEEDSHPVG